MPRLARVDAADYAYHVINRVAGRLRIFETPTDYAEFESLLIKAKEETGMRILAYCLMPNHWHLVLYPANDGDLGLFMHRLTNAHTRLVHAQTGTIGYGPLYQGRYKSFLVQDDAHLLTVIKYVERNALRAHLSSSCETWQWGSAYHRLKATSKGSRLIDPSPTPLPVDYLSWINEASSEEELGHLRHSVNKGVPYGHASWVDAMVDRYKLESTRRSAGRPRKS
jgi:putative transposase